MFEVKVHYIPWQHHSNKKQRCLDRSWCPPPFPQQCQHPHQSWLLPEGGVSGSQVQGKQGTVQGRGVAFGPHGVISAPPPSIDQRWGSSIPGSWSKEGRVRRWTLRFCNLDVSRLNCLLSRLKMDPSGATDYIREDTFFFFFCQGLSDKEALPCSLPSGPQNNRKGPRKERKKKKN